VLRGGAGRTGSRVSSARALLLSAIALCALLLAPGASWGQTFPLTNPCPASSLGGTCQPAGITAGPDGNIWFTEENGNRIGRITLGGAITEFPTSSGALPVEIVSAGGRLWFTQLGRTKIGAITTTGTITEYPSGSSLTAPADGITLGPDGALWFTEFSPSTGTSRIGKMATDGTLIDQFTLPSGSGPGDIAVGPDNRLWFTQSNGKIGSISTDGTLGTPYPISGTFSDPSGITASGGGLWFTEHAANQVSRITVTGEVGPITPVGAGPSAIATGPDGYLWFTLELGGKIGRISPGGAPAGEFPASSLGAQPGGITPGPSTDPYSLWYTEFVGNAIGRIATATPGGGSLPPPARPPAGSGTKSTKKKCKVPKLRGLTKKKATRKLKKARCKYRFRGRGRVRSTKPKAGRTTTGRVTVKLKRGRR
jgi:virginiamycin B lyase